MNVMAWEHLSEPDLTGRTVVMTGASDGLGREAALQLARWGADLVLPVRTRHKGRRSPHGSAARPAGRTRCS